LAWGRGFSEKKTTVGPNPNKKVGAKTRRVLGKRPTIIPPQTTGGTTGGEKKKKSTRCWAKTGVRRNALTAKSKIAKNGHTENPKPHATPPHPTTPDEKHPKNPGDTGHDRSPRSPPVAQVKP